MSKTGLSALACLLLSLSVTPVMAMSPTTQIDVKCFLVGTTLIQSQDIVTRNSGQSLALYYLGRLDGREPSLDLEKAVLAVADTLKPQDLASEAQRCGQIISFRAQTVASINDALIHRATSATDSPPATPGGTAPTGSAPAGSAVAPAGSAPSPAAPAAPPTSTEPAHP